MNKPAMVYSPHAFRAHVDDVSELPIQPRCTESFYLVTPRPDAPVAKRRYFVIAQQKEKGASPRIIVAHDKSQAMEFDNLRLAESFATFINNHELFPDGEEFWITLDTAKQKREVVKHSWRTFSV